MILPILISVSVAPRSYFFCAAAGSTPQARPNTIDASSMPRVCVMSTSLMPSAFCRSCGILKRFQAKWKPVRVRAGSRALALLAGHHRSEQFPALALEAHHLQLLERGEIGRAGLDFGARQIDADLEVEVGGLLHDVFAGEVVTALLQHLFEALGHAIAEGG